MRLHVGRLRDLPPCSQAPSSQPGSCAASEGGCRHIGPPGAKGMGGLGGGFSSPETPHRVCNGPAPF